MALTAREHPKKRIAKSRSKSQIKSQARSKRRKSSASAARRNSGGQFSSVVMFLGYLATVLVICVSINFIYQILRKPTEIVGFLGEGLKKSPSETWRNYGEDFKAKATQIMTADLLAALAQAESSGNPVVRTYWKWNFSRLDRLYAPASSSVGMFQITEGTFDEAKQYCLVEGIPIHQREGDLRCYGSLFYSRLVPSHAIEMTSARLHFLVDQVLSDHQIKNVTVKQKQDLAVIIHLCGLQKGRQLARAGMRASRIGLCGDHSPVAYLNRVASYQRKFKLLMKQQAEQEPAFPVTGSTNRLNVEAKTDQSIWQ